MPEYPQTSFLPPPGATRVTLVRHGQSAPADPDRPFDLVDGHGDPHLTELGRQQAETVADRLESEAIDALYVSSLTRTHQTAAPLADRLGLEPVVERDLREVFLGDWEGGLARSMLAAGEHPAVVEFRQTVEWGSLPGAETNAELTERTSSALSRVATSHVDQHIVCFVHGGVIAALCSHATGTHLRSFSGSDNCAIHRLVLTPDRWLLRGFNDVAHLGDRLTPPAAHGTPRATAPPEA